MAVQKKHPLKQCYVYTDYITGYDIDSSKNYYILVFVSEEDAVAEMKNRFERLLGSTNLKDKDKDKIREKFEAGLAKKKYSFHFRDNRIPAEPQYFGKVHRRSILREDVPCIGGYPVKENPAAMDKAGWRRGQRKGV